QTLYKATTNGLPFEYTFLDDDYRRLYLAETRVATLSQYAAALAIVISCLGLFGLAAYTAQKRQKEIGIRKVIGAGVDNIVLLLSRDFLQLTGLALLIDFPTAAWLLTRWLHGFAYRVPLKADSFLLAGGVTVLITILSISLQCIKAALLNPIKALHSE
ncbi:MAG TPA: FtsX-like permease family protein, partial [Puia sp.]|nr:FtsX-like permease family protein [Puia sp.]